MLFLGGAPDWGPGAVGVVSPGLGGDGEAEGDRFVHDQLFRGEVRGEHGRDSLLWCRDSIRGENFRRFVVGLRATMVSGLRTFWCWPVL